MKLKITLFYACLVAISGCVNDVQPFNSFKKVVYVDGLVNKGGDGSSWDQAFKSLEQAIKQTRQKGAGNNINIIINSDPAAKYKGFSLVNDNSFAQPYDLVIRGGFKKGDRFEQNQRKNLRAHITSDIKISLFGGLVKFENLKFSREVSGGTGMWVSRTKSFYLKNCEITSLDATDSGGTSAAVWIEYSGFRIANVSFKGNRVSKDGAALVMFDSDGVLSNSKFVDNSDKWANPKDIYIFSGKYILSGAGNHIKSPKSIFYSLTGEYNDRNSSPDAKALFEKLTAPEKD